VSFHGYNELFEALYDNGKTKLLRKVFHKRFAKDLFKWVGCTRQLVEFWKLLRTVQFGFGYSRRSNYNSVEETSTDLISDHNCTRVMALNIYDERPCYVVAEYI
jgi:hypothetical protein